MVDIAAGTELRRDAESDRSSLHGKEIKTAEQNLGEILLTAKGKIMENKGDVNKAVMDYLKGQIEYFRNDNSSYIAGMIHGACQAFCMAGIITAKQWKELDEMKEKLRQK